ncbi:four-carbon acid sugar kinase family protein [Mitsuaria sp. GD03876]|uniref:four-carbon acid sugar kinase family protein n=1 Tax=Mitsuaria sp. GD03876 TaxID=2975399 RepID=UPI00244BA6BB|nr:four-carbon acid sugar kinase family protein [Mitsuaria sp. GD03876]MDH0863332.1 hypothetical protein [Mitsuaria sp. GD03876]
MITILADDLTSALDGAAPFAARGLASTVALHADAVGQCQAEVLALDLDTRSLLPEEARRRFLHAAMRMRRSTLVYKTVDSTLRGHPGAETAAVLAGSGRVHAVIAPAFPAAGRTTSQGRQFVDGQPVHLTAFARDPLTPVRSSRVVDAMRGAEPGSYTIHDAATDGDLDALVARVGTLAEVLWVGSPGLAGALARALPDRRHVAGTMPWTPARRVLVVVGSLHPANDAQLAALGGAGVPLVPLSLEADSADRDRTSGRLRQAFATHPVVALVSPRAAGSDPAWPKALALRAGLIARRNADCFDGLVVTGGDTARRVVDQLDAATLDLAGEVEAGVPFGVLHLPGRSIPFATKAGGFGLPSTLLRCVDRLRGRFEV